MLKGEGGSFSIQEFILQILDHLTGHLEHEIDTKGSFQGSGYVCATIVMRKIKIAM